MDRPFNSPQPAAPIAYPSSAAARRIWGSVDAILLIFAGSAAEFALNRAVDWLFWTGRLPRRPIDRFFETVSFAQTLAFGDDAAAEAAIERINRAHSAVERGRGAAIPPWAYRHVLSMLIDYGERAHQVVFGPMTERERQEHFEVMLATGRGMRIEGLPATYAEYQAQRREHLRNDIAYSDFTALLYARYREHLGGWRMRGLLRLQASIIPPEAARLLGLRRYRHVDLLLRAYRRLRRRRVLRLLGPLLLPRPYGSRLAALERL